METKPLLYGLIGFFMGGLLVASAATYERQAGEEQVTMKTGETSMSQMTEMLRNAQGDEYDELFITHMIDHHQAAVDMARLSGTQAKHQEIKDLSRDIIVAQEKEIARMKQWQIDWGYEPHDAPAGHGMH